MFVNSEEARQEDGTNSVGLAFGRNDRCEALITLEQWVAGIILFISSAELHCLAFYFAKSGFVIIQQPL
jgi:hypothetical protein